MNPRFSIVIFCALFAANMVPRSCRAQVLLHDFDDGTLGGWEDIGDFAAESSFGPTLSSIVDGQLIISSNGPAPQYDDDPASFFRLTWGASVDSTSFTNGYVRTTVSPLENETIGGLVLRAGVDPNEVDYEFWRDAGLGAFWFGRWEKNTEFFEVLAGTDNFAEPYVEGEEWIIEAGIVGSEISLKYWKPGELEPAAPQLTAHDTGIAPYDVDASRVELAVYHSSSTPVAVGAAFDDVSFTAVPEPTSISLLGLGILALALTRRSDCRSRNR